MLFHPSIRYLRKFCSRISFDWAIGSKAIASKLFQAYTVEPEDSIKVDPRGMRVFELKKRLNQLPGFTGGIDKTADHHEEIVRTWQSLYNVYMNGNVKLPGRDPAGPLTFHHDADPDNVKIVYDKHGRVQH
jgi:hypothetical protein